MGDPVIHRSVANVNGINIFYRDTRSGAQSMLCLHGRWGRGETWVEMIHRYADRFRVIAPDQRGHGLSDKPESAYTSSEFAADAFAMLEHLRCQPAIVIGHSMGARVAGYLAALYPEAVRAAVLIDENAEGSGSQIAADPETDPDPCNDGLTWDWPTPYPAYESAVRDLTRRLKRETAVRYFLESLMESLDGYDFMFSRRAMAAIGWAYEEWYEMLPRIECPVLLIRAMNSWNFSAECAEKMRSLIQNCMYYEATGSDHMVYASNPEEFYQNLDEFIATIR